MKYPRGIDLASGIKHKVNVVGGAGLVAQMFHSNHDNTHNDDDEDSIVSVAPDTKAIASGKSSARTSAKTSAMVSARHVGAELVAPATAILAKISIPEKSSSKFMK